MLNNFHICKGDIKRKFELKVSYSRSRMFSNVYHWSKRKPWKLTRLRLFSIPVLDYSAQRSSEQCFVVSCSPWSCSSATSPRASGCASSSCTFTTCSVEQSGSSSSFLLKGTNTSLKLAKIIYKNKILYLKIANTVYFSSVLNTGATKALKLVRWQVIKI